MNRKLLEFMPCHSRLWRQMDLHPGSTGFPRSRKKIQVSPWDRSVFPSFKGRGCCRVRPKKECSCRLEQKVNRNDYVTNSWLFNRPFLKIQKALFLRFSVIKRYHSFGCRCWVLVFGQHIEGMVEAYWLLYGSFEAANRGKWLVKSMHTPANKQLLTGAWRRVSIWGISWDLKQAMQVEVGGNFIRSHFMINESGELFPPPMTCTFATFNWKPHKSQLMEFSLVYLLHIHFYNVSMNLWI